LEVAPLYQQAWFFDGSSRHGRVSAIDRLTAALADRYRIERELGQGGMATVYLAEDLRHKRKVALKVLKPELAAVLGADRFVQEITTTAALQHPHILPLFDSGTADGFLYYVMPFINGETLRDKLNRETQLGVDEAVKLAIEVADALHYAHSQGVIHRDIKPENILLANGRPMVADFGIALAVSAAAGGRMTETGLSLGTPHYMSPEQATADKEITARSDVYSLGSVLFEMLAGQPPHLGGSAQQIIMKIIAEPAPLVTTLRKAVPPNVAAAVATSLEKLPADRFASAKGLAEALANPAYRSAGTEHAFTGAPTAARFWRRAALALAMVAVAAVLAAIWALAGSSSEPHDVGLPPTSPMRMEDVYRNFAVAHDGSFIIYEAKVGESSQLWYRSLTGLEVHAIAGTDGAHGSPRIAPDDKRVAFVSGGEVKIVGIGGGPVTTVARAGDPQGGGWLESGSIFFSNDDGHTLHWIDPQAGPGRTAVIVYCIMPQPLGGDRMLCAGGAEKYANVRSLAKPSERRFVRRSEKAGGSGPPLLLGSDFRLVDGKYLVYLSMDGTLSATRFESFDSLTVGKSVSLMPMTRRSPYSGEGQFDLTRAGTLVYVPGVNAEVGRLVRRSPNGPAVPLPVIPAAYLRFTPSPDGQRLAVVVEGIQQQELWLYDLRTATHETIDQALYVGGASWSPDGRHIAYRKLEFDHPDQETLYLSLVDSPAKPRILAQSDVIVGRQPSSYLAENFLLVGALYNGATATIIDPTATPVKVDTLPLTNHFISISPDRKWIAYQNSGATGIVVQPWPSLDRRYQIDAQGREPLWKSPTEFVYFSYLGRDGAVSQTFSRVTIDPTSSTPVGKPEILFVDPRFMDTPGWSHAIMPGGDLLYLQASAENLGYYVRVVPDWVKTMKRAVDAANR
jgi:serine/threonine-protein kinase